MKGNKFEQDYKALIRRVIHNGADTKNRTNVDTVTKFGEQLTIDLTKGFPIVTGKKIFFDKALHEYFWMQDGGTTIAYLNKHDIHWWNEFADAFGYLGKTYGYQIRNFNGEEDQMAYVYNEIANNSRRACVSLWNPSELKETKLPPCFTFMNYVRVNDVLNLSVTFRSSDVFLGLPYDVIVLSLFLINTAKFCDLKVGELKLNLDNAHIYRNHTKQLFKYLDSPIYSLPELKDGKLIDYIHGPFIAAKMNN